MTTVQQPSTTPKKSTLITALFGGIPLSIGLKLRQSLYRSVLGAIGSDVRIHPHVDLVAAQHIQLGNNVQLWNNVALNCWTSGSHIQLDEAVVLDRGIYLQALGGQITVGQNTYIGPYVCMAGPGNIRIGKNCLIASQTTLYANNHVFSDPNTPINQQSLSFDGISIGNDCWLGSGVRVMDGISIGDGCVIGAGAVLTRDLPAYSVAVGVPAKVISSRINTGGSEFLDPVFPKGT